MLGNEVADCLFYIGIEIGYVEKSIGLQWIREINEVLRMLNGLKKNYAN